MEIDWKKKYEEALNKARELHGTVAAGRDFLAEIFPELCESEDERIRKELLEVIRHCYEDGGYTLCTDDYKKYSDYLEKQKDSPMPEDTVIFQKGVAEGRRLERVEQKPWSEEDEKMRLETIRVLESGCESYIKESGCLPSWHKVITWLKSLRPQSQLM